MYSIDILFRRIDINIANSIFCMPFGTPISMPTTRTPFIGRLYFIYQSIGQIISFQMMPPLRSFDDLDGKERGQKKTDDLRAMATLGPRTLPGGSRVMNILLTGNKRTDEATESQSDITVQTQGSCNQSSYRGARSTLDLVHSVVGHSSWEESTLRERKVNELLRTIWAATWDFQQCGILTSVDKDEPVQPPIKLRNSNAVQSVA